MTILIANIGTSDISIEVDVDGKKYFLPIDFLTEEPNLEKQLDGLSTEHRNVWENQIRYVTNSAVYQELGFEKGKKQQSREFTKILLHKYCPNCFDSNNTDLIVSDLWHQRIRLTRIGGVIKKAVEMGVKRAYIFITNQVTENKPNGQMKDTIYLFDIVKKWLEKESFDISLEGIELKADIPANNQDLLLDEYYSKLNKIYQKENLEKKYNEPVMVSLKGGTSQMKTALQIQAMGSQFQKLVFLDPQLNIDQLLNGEVSRCELFSYWRYQRTQKYEAVRQLLEARWDFDGAMEILKEWKSYLNFLVRQEAIDTEINNSRELIRQVLQRLEIAKNHFNLDSSWRLNYQLQPYDDLGNLQKVKNNYDKILNLYTQCVLLWELNQVANFISKLGSFCEEILHEIIKSLDGEKYFNKDRYPNDWYFTKSDLAVSSNAGINLWQKFYEIEIRQYYNSKLKNHDWKKYPYAKLMGRFSKRNFIEALIKFRSSEKEIQMWREIKESLAKLEYWIELRNVLTHSAKGFSKTSIKNILNQDCNRYKRGDRDGIANKAKQACKPEEILEELTNIMNQMSDLPNQSYGFYIGKEEPYYIYSEIKEWVVQKLQEEVSMQ